MKRFAAVLLLLAACARYSGDDETPPPRERPIPEAPTVRDAEPMNVKWSGAPRIGYNAALRELVSAGFEVTMSNPEAGILRAERLTFDRELTKWFENDRRAYFESLKPLDREMAERRPTPPTEVYRRMRVNVAIGPDRITVTPEVGVCAKTGDDQPKCGPRHRLRRDEAALVDAVAAAIQHEGPPPPDPSNSSTL